MGDFFRGCIQLHEDVHEVLFTFSSSQIMDRINHIS